MGTVSAKMRFLSPPVTHIGASWVQVRRLNHCITAASLAL